MSTVMSLMAKLALDTSEFGKGLDAAEGSASGWAGKVGGFLKTAVPVAAITGAVVGIGKALYDAGQAAAEEEAGMARLKTAVGLSGLAWEDATWDIEKYLEAELRRTALDDGEGRAAITRLSASTGDYTKALELMGPAQDLARGAGIDLEMAAKLVGQAYEGNIGVLGRYVTGIDGVKTPGAALALLQEQWGGQAEAYGNTTAGAQDKLKIALGNLKETIGGAVLPVMGNLATAAADLAMRAMPIVQGAVDALGPIFQNVFGWIRENVMPIISTIVGYVVENWPQIQTTISTVLGAVWGIVSTVFTTIKTFITENLGGIQAVVTTIWGYIKGSIENALTIIRGVIKVITSLIHGDWSGAWNGIKQVLTGVWNQIKLGISTALNLIKTILGGAWRFIKTAATGAWEGVKASILGKWDSLKTAVNTKLTQIKTALTGAWNSVKSTATGAWNAFKGAILGVWNILRTEIGGRIAWWKDTLGNAWTAIKNTASGAWGTFKTTVLDIWNGLRRSVDDKITGLKTALSTAWTSIKNVAETTWEGIKNVIKGPVNAIIGMINTFIGAWNRLEIRIPGFGFNIPSITVLGQTIGGGYLGWEGTTIGTPDLPLIPTLAQGGVVTKPTLAMIGEKGPEAVVPLGRRGQQAGPVTNFYLNANYRYQPEVSLARDVVLLRKLYGGA